MEEGEGVFEEEGDAEVGWGAGEVCLDGGKLVDHYGLELAESEVFEGRERFEDARVFAEEFLEHDAVEFEKINEFVGQDWVIMALDYLLDSLA